MDENKRIELKDIQRLSLAILLDIDDFCRKNDIRYYLACGTLLGAVRHQGFIPWDDDVDIMMPRSDYKRFLDSYHSEKYQLVKPSAGRYYYAKVYDPMTIKYEDNIDYQKY